MFTLTALAIIPGVIIIIVVFKMDTVEKEPVGLIVKLLIFGCISCAPACFFEKLISAYGPQFNQGSVAYCLFEAFVVAALCEEVCKFLLMYFGSWKNRNFDFRFDGIVYGVAVAVGFATLENVLYVTSYGFATGLVRAVMAVPLHSFCGVFMGIMYGAAKKAALEGKNGEKTKYFILALIIPMIIHGIYDTLAFMGTTGAELALLAFVVLLYIVGIKYIKHFSKDDWKAGFYANPETGGYAAATDGVRYATGSEAPRYGSAAWENQYGVSGTDTYEAAPEDTEVYENMEQAQEANYGSQGGYDNNYSGQDSYDTYGSYDTYDTYGNQGGYEQYTIPKSQFRPDGSSVHKSNRLSVAGFVCGILALMSAGGGGLLPILAIVFGIRGRNSTPGQKNPTAKAAIWMGVIALMLGGILGVGASMMGYGY